MGVLRRWHPGFHVARLGKAPAQEIGVVVGVRGRIVEGDVGDFHAGRILLKHEPRIDRNALRADFHVGVTPELAATSVRPEMRGGGKAGASGGGGAARRGVVRLPVTASFAGTLDKPEILGAP